jgi:hypothetical protein
MDDGGLIFDRRKIDFSFRVLSDYGAHPKVYPVNIGGNFLEVKATGA